MNILLTFVLAVLPRKMYNNLSKIFLLFVILAFTFCQKSDNNTEQEAVESSSVSARVIPITRLPAINSNIVINDVSSPEIYKNTTNSEAKTFGEINNTDINKVFIGNSKFSFNNEEKTYIPINVDEKSLIEQTHWILSFTFDNDIFANSDYYFTNGFKLELIAPFLSKSPLNKILIGTRNPAIQQSGFSLVQNLYTPTDPDTEDIQYGDRPFSAYLTFGQFMETYNFDKKIHIKSELDFGIIGPLSFGAEVQSSIHEIEPVGWVNQIENDIIVSYSFRIDKGIISSPNFELNTSGRATFGTLYNKAGGGLNLRFGNFMPVYKGPFSTFNNKNPGGRYQFWIFAESMVDVIGYDATLQGGMFAKNNPYVIPNSKINRLVFEASFGFALYYNSIGIEYKQFFITPEFQGASYFGWGQLKGVFAF